MDVLVLVLVLSCLCVYVCVPHTCAAYAACRVPWELFVRELDRFIDEEVPHIDTSMGHTGR